jgi:hypothetical protein
MAKNFAVIFIYGRKNNKKGEFRMPTTLSI